MTDISNLARADQLAPVGNACGNCAHFERSVQDLTTGTCFGAPPTPFIVGAQQDALGRLNMQVELLRPKLDATARACALHERKSQLIGLGTHTEGRA